MNKKLFLVLYWVLTFTWALPTTLLGGLVALGLLITGHKPYVFCSGLCFPIAEDWGFELGVFFIGSKDKDIQLMEHEYGHHLQACFLLGPLTLFVATIPSILRYWMREVETSVKRGLIVMVFFFITLAICVCLAFIPSIVCFILYFILLAYTLVVVDWLISIKNKYDMGCFDDYDDFWVEGDASRRGKEAHEKYFKKS